MADSRYCDMHCIFLAFADGIRSLKEKDKDKEEILIYDVFRDILTKIKKGCSIHITYSGDYFCHNPINYRNSFLEGES